MHPGLIYLLSLFTEFCLENKTPSCVITSIYRPPNDGISVSSTHAEFRAFDVRLRDWTKDQVDLLEKFIYQDKKAIDLGAISSETLKSRPLYIHKSEEGVIHGHFQIAKGL